MNKKINAISILIVFMISLIVGFVSSGVKGQNGFVKSDLQLGTSGEIFFTEDFIEWSNLPEEERKNALMPTMYETSYRTIDDGTMGGSYTIDNNITTRRFSLKDEISRNVNVGDQKTLNVCWSFASTGALESSLALKNKKNNTNTSKVYDFSEKYLDIASTRTLNDGVNVYGTERELGSANVPFVGLAGLINGHGITNEANMPYETTYASTGANTTDLNKTATARLKDYIAFDAVTDNNKTQIMKQMKSHLKNYGGIIAGIKGGTSAGNSYINNRTGAINVNNSAESPDHEILIVGWDDDYNVDNFNTSVKPANSGAWIIKNSWGDKYRMSPEDVVNYIYNYNQEVLSTQEWNQIAAIDWNSDQLPSNAKALLSLLINKRNTYNVTDGEIREDENGYYYSIGDDGYYYVSYEDKTIYTVLLGLIEAQDDLGYDYMYQYNEIPYTGYFECRDTNSNVIRSVVECEIFDRKTTQKEYLNEVAVYGFAGDSFEVYINENGDGKNWSNLKKVNINSADASINYSGYHTIRLSNPVELKGTKFTVAIKVTNQNGVTFPIEAKINSIGQNTQFSQIITETNKSFVGIYGSNDGWVLPKMVDSSDNNVKRDSDLTINAFTILGNSQENPENSTVNNTVDNNTIANNTIDNNTVDNNTISNNTIGNDITNDTPSNFTIGNNTTPENKTTTNQNTTPRFNTTNTSNGGSSTSSSTSSRSIKTTVASTSSDITVADKSIPQTGSNEFMVGFLITFVMGVGVILYINYRRIRIK